MQLLSDNHHAEGCWITGNYPTQCILLHFVFEWVTIFVSLVSYIPLALVIKGTIEVNGLSIRSVGKAERKEVEKLRRRTRSGKEVDTIAMQLIL